MRRRPAQLLASTALLLASCVADIESNTFTCADGTCPPGFVCGATERCIDEDTPGAPFYSECTADADCFEQSCVKVAGASTGLCSRTCESATEDCPDVGGRVGVCNYFGSGSNPTGVCQAGCSRDSDCGVGPSGKPLDCISTPMTAALASCFVPIAAWDPPTACSGDAACAGPEACARPAGGGTSGICAQPCGRVNDLCAGTDLCVATQRTLMIPFMTGFACLPSCDPSTGCGSSALTCRALVSMGPTVCVPTAWP